MAVKMRLARRGRKKLAIYNVVVADSRSPRDGKYIENLGIYNPNTNPATLDFDEDKAFEWIMKGAQPTDTVRRILSYKGIMLRKHLQIGVLKGAITQEDADKKFEAWKQEKEAKIQGKVDSLSKKKADEAKKRAEEEKKKNEARAAEIAAKNTPPPAEEEVAEAPEAVAEAEAPAQEEAHTESVTEEKTPVAEAETVVKGDEASAEEAQESPSQEETPVAEEKKEEAKAEEKAEEPKAEAEGDSSDEEKK